jgi:hypothetical protein
LRLSTSKKWRELIPAGAFAFELGTAFFAILHAPNEHVNNFAEQDMLKQRMEECFEVSCYSYNTCYTCFYGDGGQPLGGSPLLNDFRCLWDANESFVHFAKQKNLMI